MSKTEFTKLVVRIQLQDMTSAVRDATKILTMAEVKQMNGKKGR